MWARFGAKWRLGRECPSESRRPSLPRQWKPLKSPIPGGTASSGLLSSDFWSSGNAEFWVQSPVRRWEGPALLHSPGRQEHDACSEEKTLELKSLGDLSHVRGDDFVGERMGPAFCTAVLDPFRRD